MQQKLKPVKDRKKILLVVQRYGLEVNGGAELHCRWIAEHLNAHFDVEVFTTKALEYITWKNNYRKRREVINGVKVRRFSVDKERNLHRFGLIQNKIFYENHTLDDEVKWVEEGGPVSKRLMTALEKEGQDAYAILFWSYRYWPSFRGLDLYPEKSIVIPTAERDRLLDMELFKNTLRKPAGHIFLTPEERDIVSNCIGKIGTSSIIASCGVEPIHPDKKKIEAFRKKHGLKNPYILYVGRVDRNKGCNQMFDFFSNFKRKNQCNLDLVVIGSLMMKAPRRDDIVILGYMDDETKSAALAGAEALLMPSFYESLSIILLEAWAAGCPTLANAQCEVLKGQNSRSLAGLVYNNYLEFEENLLLLLNNKILRKKLSANGRKFTSKHQSWEIITKRYSDFISEIGNNSNKR
jgi:glycosyltransferase involved in cell wall biosynthesis